MGHLTHPTPKSLNHINLNTIPLSYLTFTCAGLDLLKVWQTLNTLYFSSNIVKLKHQSPDSCKLQLSTQALVYSMLPIGNLLMFSEEDKTFCFQGKEQESIHIDVEQLLKDQHWKFVLVVVIGVINRLNWC